MVTQGPGGTLTGRVVGSDGKPLAGWKVHLNSTRRAVREAFDLLTRRDLPTTDANGEFRVGSVFHGEEFRLEFKSGKRSGPDADRPLTGTVKKHGDTLRLDVRVDEDKSK